MSLPKQLTFGLHAVSALLENHPERVKELYIQKDRQDKKMTALMALARDQQIALQYFTRQTLDEMTEHANHQGIVAIHSARKRVYSENDLQDLLENFQHADNQGLLLLILDGVQDPHNLGACFRTADAAGVHAIIVPKDKSVGMTPTVAKVASGATETVPFVQVTNLARTLKFLKDQGIWIFGADADASSTLYEANFTGNAAIVLGAEGSGLRRLTREYCDYLIKIPMLGTIASLNVSVATGIFLFEVQRQRSKSG